MSNNINNQSINQTAYASVKNAKVYASADNIEQDSKITRDEALRRKNAIFNVAQNEETILNEVLSSSTRLSDDEKETVKSLIQKYLGGISLNTLLNNWTGLATINYTAVEINDSENVDNVRAQIDTKVDAQIEQGFNNVGSKAINQYKAAITKALSQVETELAGDADIVDEKGEVNTKDEKFNLSDIEYKRSSENGENTNVATYNSNSKGADATKGYSSTVQYLKANGAKAEEKIVNGVKQMVYEIKADGQKRYVVVDDAGQVHNLRRDKGFLRASKFTTEDSIEDAKYQANNDKDNNNDIKEGTKVKVKVRKVDGQEQSVMIWKDENGNKHSRVIDYNNVTGLTTSLDVHQVNAGGRAKYASETSGLGALVNKNSKDEIYFDNAKHKLHTDKWTDNNGGVHDSYAQTEGKRMKLDADNIDVAISNITKLVQAAGGNIQNVENGINVNINGHVYTIDKMNNKSADKTMRLIQGELDRIAQNDDSMTDTIPLEITFKPFDIVEDNRIDANIKRDGSEITYPDGKEYTKTDERWKSGEIVEGAGVDKVTHRTGEKAQSKVNTVKYDKTSLTRNQFVSEGWGTNSVRTKEQQYLKLMDSQAIKGNSKSVRNLKTGKEFAERFIAAYKQQNNDGSNYNADTLADAIMAANPSLFDGLNRIMYQNADFSRLNLPTNIDRFKVTTPEVKNDASPIPLNQEPPVSPEVIKPNPLEKDSDNDDLVNETPPVLSQPVDIDTKPVIKDRGLEDEEIVQYTKVDDNYIAKSNDISNINSRMSEIERKYNFERGDVQGRLRANLSSGLDNSDFDEYWKMEFFMNTYGNDFEKKFKEVLKNWVDTPKDADVSKKFFRRGDVTLSNVRKETLPDGTKVYNTNQGYYNLYFDGYPGEKMDESELKKHGWVKTE